jgi:hypothetical protein
MSISQQQREELRQWSAAYNKLDPKTLEDEAEAWILSALAILEKPKTDKQKMTRVVMCRNTWPEPDQKDFVVFEVLQEETDADAFARAAKAYSPNNEFYIALH